MIGRTARTALRNSRQRARPPRKVCPYCIEGDHIAGENQIPHIVVDACQPHHAVLTEERLAAGAEMEKQPNPIKSVEMALRSLAVTGRANAAAIEKLSKGLEFCADKLKVSNSSRRRKPKSKKNDGQV